MQSIKFSHIYEKMPIGLQGCLAHEITPPATFITSIKKVHYNDLSPEFIDQDTKTVAGEYYPLPKIWLIYIELWTEGQKWQTLRPWNPEKYKYYHGLIGQEVNIILEKK